MAEINNIPMFPLTILPIPGELVPLHIFEPRYRQMLQDLESTDMSFGIYFSHQINTAKIGSLMKLKSIIKRYPEGESDIMVKCVDIICLDKLYRNFSSKLYPGGDIIYSNVVVDVIPAKALSDSFMEYLNLRDNAQNISPFNIYQIAIELNLDVNNRYKFLLAPKEKKESFLMNQLTFQIHVLRQETKSKDLYHLN